MAYDVLLGKENGFDWRNLAGARSDDLISVIAVAFAVAARVGGSKGAPQSLKASVMFPTMALSDRTISRPYSGSGANPRRHGVFGDKAGEQEFVQ